MEKVGRSRSRLLDGWGIHLCTRGGWVWNLWGYDCVDIDSTGGKKLRLGTDAPEGLAAFLQSKLPEPKNPDAGLTSPEQEPHSQPE